MYKKVSRNVVSPKNIKKKKDLRQWGSLTRVRLLPPAGHLVNYRTQTNDVNNSSKIFYLKKKKKADVEKLRSQIFTRVNKVENYVLQSLRSPGADLLKDTPVPLVWADSSFLQNVTSSHGRQFPHHLCYHSAISLSQCRPVPNAGPRAPCAV